jgi:8-oxo-dGTP pyrophosphatase MutT (NUDIX family)
MIVFKDPAVPRHAVQCIAIDRFGRVLVIHRSDKVRSAKNVWSFPSGMHDIGETLEMTMVKELNEEFGLLPSAFGYLGVYENIAGDPSLMEHYHWVISVFAVLVDDLSKTVNKEPDKHDQFHIIDLTELDTLTQVYTFHQTFKTWYDHNQLMIEKGLKQLANF